MRSMTALLCLTILFIPGLARAFDLTGQWRGSLYGSKIVADLSQDGDFMSGVVTVFGPFGGETVYHVQGAVFGNGHMYVLHGSGHVFEGDFSGPDAIGGVLTLVGGRTFSLRAERGAASAAVSPVQSGAGRNANGGTAPASSQGTGTSASPQTGSPDGGTPASPGGGSNGSEGSGGSASPGGPGGSGGASQSQDKAA